MEEREEDAERRVIQAKQKLDRKSFQYNNVAEGYSDLQPPVFNLRRESLLFDENATTLQDNNVQRLWDACYRNLPYVVHGARPERNGVTDPLAALYNMIFVRLPVLGAGLIYAYNQASGHPLIVDLGIVGDGAFELSPLLVALLLWIILR